MSTPRRWHHDIVRARQRSDRSVPVRVPEEGGRQLVAVNLIATGPGGFTRRTHSDSDRVAALASYAQTCLLRLECCPSRSQPFQAFGHLLGRPFGDQSIGDYKEECTTITLLKSPRVQIVWLFAPSLLKNVTIFRREAPNSPNRRPCRHFTNTSVQRFPTTLIHKQVHNHAERIRVLVTIPDMIEQQKEQVRLQEQPTRMYYLRQLRRHITAMTIS